jgi:hypothetical protein
MFRQLYSELLDLTPCETSCSDNGKAPQKLGAFVAAASEIKERYQIKSD